MSDIDNTIYIKTTHHYIFLSHQSVVDMTSLDPLFPLLKSLTTIPPPILKMCPSFPSETVA